MPLITAATLAYAAGLLIGYGGVVIPALIAAGIAGVVALTASRPRSAAIAIVAMAGLLTAQDDLARQRRCAREMPALSGWRVLLLDDAAPGAYVRATIVGVCSSPATLTVRRGTGRAGEEVLATGSAAVAGRRVVLRNATLAPAVGGSALVRARARAGVRIDRVFGSDAPIARALLVADARSIAPEIRDRYAAAGLVHMLSISGLHVAIIAAALDLLFRAARLSPQAGRLGTILVTALYIAMIGAPAPAVRSGVMLAAVTATRILQRPTSPWAPIALGALIPLLLQPRTILDLGYQLSVAGIAALAASSALGRRMPQRFGAAGPLGRAAAASVIATAVTAPLIAWHFGRVSLIGPLTNLAAGPVIGLAQPILFAALILAPLEPAARFAADAVHPLLALFDLIATAGAAVPHGSVPVAPTLVAAMCAGIASASFIVATASRFPGRALVAGAAAIATMAWLPDGRAKAGMVELHVIDVGQGDAIALRSARGEWLLIDAGRSWRGGDAGRSTVIPYLRRHGGRVAGFVLSHPHADHAGGAPSVIRALRPPLFWDPAFVAPSTAYRELLVSVREANAGWRRVHPKDRWSFDGLTVEFLGPDSAWTASLTDPNEASAVLLIRVGGVRFLLVGDAERAEERWLLDNARELLRADVLKVGHHGSSTSSTADFLAAVDPRIAVISVGAGNMYHHPSPDVLRALAARGAEVLRTDQAGDVVIRTDGERIWIETREGAWESSAGFGRR